LNNEWPKFNFYVTDSYEIEKDKYNVVHPAATLSCEAIKINIKPAKEKAVGILDVDVSYENGIE